MHDAPPQPDQAALSPGVEIGPSQWVAITQEMISQFGAVTQDPDPMHVDPAWARQNSPYGCTIAFGFLTLSLLTHLLNDAIGARPDAENRPPGYFLNYGFDRVRLVAPVPVGSRVRGLFRVIDRAPDEQGRWLTRFDSRIEIEGSDRPALAAEWLSIWVPPSSS